MERFLGFNNFRGNFIEINIKYLFFTEIKILNHEGNSSQGKFCSDDSFFISALPKTQKITIKMIFRIILQNEVLGNICICSI